MKKTVKKITAVLLCTIMMLGIAPLDGLAELDIRLPKLNINFKLPDLSNLFSFSASAEDTPTSGTCGENLSWTLDDEGTLTISGTGEMDDYFDKQPAPWNQLSSSIKKVIIGQGVSSIGRYAFYQCKKLNVIVIPFGVTKIGNNAFERCYSLKNIEIPSSVTSFGTAFYKSGLKSLVIPDSVTFMSGQAFYYCTSLETVTIPGSIANISTLAFSGCKSLSKVIIYSGVASIRYGAFEDCSSLLNVVIPDSVTSIDDYAFCRCTALTSITIPDSVTSIGQHAFYGCTSLSIEIPNSVVTIRSDAFLNVRNIIYHGNLSGSPWGAKCVNGYVDGFFLYENDTMKNIIGCSTEANGLIIIPDSVNTIASYAFYNCSNITEISMSDSVTDIGSYAFAECVKLGSIYFSKRLINIGADAFYNCVSLKNVSIPNSVTTIGKSAFRQCYNLTSVILSDNITSIGSGIFYYCINLTSIDIPDSVTSIGGLAFEYCASLTSIIIPSGITSIGGFAFSNCGLKNITIPSGVTEIGTNAFLGITNVRYNGNALGAPWGARAVNTYIEGCFIYYDNTKTTLLGCLPNAPANVLVPSTVEQVGTNCFAGCDNIETITFDMNTDIVFEENAFSDCANLETVSSPNTTSDGITYSYAVSSGPMRAPARNGVTTGNKNRYGRPNGIQFCNRDKSGEYVIPDYISYICDNAFFNCTELTISIPDSVMLTRIGREAFTNTANDNSRGENSPFIIGKYFLRAVADITSYSLPSYIFTIADSAFEACADMTSFSCNGVKHIGRGCFKGCSSLSSVDFGSDVISCGENVLEGTAFIDESSNKINGVTYVGNTLICADADISSCDIREGTTCIAESAFCDCTQLSSIEIPGTVNQIADKSFFCCVNLNSVAIPEGVTYIGEKAFGDCRHLQSVSIPSSVSSIEDFAFWGCFALESVNVVAENDSFMDVDGVLYTYDGTSLIQYPAGKTEDDEIFTIPENVTYIESLAFRKCNNLIKISRPEEAELGLMNPFEGCSARFTTYKDGEESELTQVAYADDGTILKSVSTSVEGEFVVPAEVIHIAQNAFSGCSGITKVIFEDGSKLKEIDNNAFLDCTGITSINIPGSVTTIGDSAFEGCTNLESVVFALNDDGKNETITTIGDRAFANTKVTYTDESLRNTLTNEDLFIGNNVLHICEYTVTAQPRCLESGKKTCSCGNYVILPPSGHNPNAPVKEKEVFATCTAEGHYDSVVYCKNCNAELSREKKTTEMKAHTVRTRIENETFSSCKEQGTYDEVTYCEVCKTVLNSETKTKELSEDHVVPETFTVENIVAPTCLADGKHDEVKYCLLCSEELERHTVTDTALGHKPDTAVKENNVNPTCLEEGSYDEVVYCEACGTELSRTGKTIPSTGHTPGERKQENIIPATCYADEEYDIVTYCRDCGAKINTEHTSRPNTRLNPALAITNKAANDGKSLAYKTTITFHAKCDGVKSEDIHWFVDGKDMGTGSSYTVSEAESSFTVEAKFYRNGSAATDDKGNPIKDSETIRIKNDIFSKIIAFFRMLFNALPKIDQK